MPPGRGARPDPGPRDTVATPAPRAVSRVAPAPPPALARVVAPPAAVRGAPQTRGDRPGSGWVWSVALLAAALGVNLAAPFLVGAACARALRTALGTGHVDVVVESWPPLALWWGRVDRMVVRARDVPTGDLRFERFSASSRGLHIDPGALYLGGSLVIRAVQSGNAQATVTQAALASALARQPGVHVEALVLRRGGVMLRGTIAVLGIDVAIEGDGQLVLNGRDAIDLILDQTTVAGAASSPVLRGRLAARVPSVVRIPPLPLGFQVTALHMDDGRLLLDASMGPP